MQNTVKPTESELEILRVLWAEGRATARKVHEALRPFKDAGYNGTLKLLQIMFEKGLVDREDSGKTHIYFALVSKEKIQQQLLDKMVNRFFDGSPSQLVMHALGNHKPSDAEIAAIEALLQKYKNQ